MVQPIIELAKRNIDHNAKKNEKFADLDKDLKQLTERWISQDKEVKDLKKMNEKMQKFEQLIQSNRTENKGKLDAQDHAIRKLQQKFDDQE